jgi:hypothetical protein
VTTADIQRLQDELYQASADVSRLRTTDALAAGRLQDELDLLREDVIYLKVKLRKERSVGRTEYTDTRTQLETLRSRAAASSACCANRSGGHGHRRRIVRVGAGAMTADDRHAQGGGSRSGRIDVRIRSTDIGPPRSKTASSDDGGRPLRRRARAHPGQLPSSGR